MENRLTKPTARQFNYGPEEGDARELDLNRLNAILSVNSEIARKKSHYVSTQEKHEAELIKHPLDSRTALAYFGLMLGIFAPATIFGRVVVGNGGGSNDDLWIIGVLILVNIVSAVAGFISGKFIGTLVKRAEETSWIKMLLLLPLIGILWGIISGGSGGLMFFLFGSVFGAIVGALVGSVALPVFGILHRALKKGDLIELNHFLPIAFGITFTLCALILSIGA